MPRDFWVLSSDGRASPLQGECQRFDSVSTHHILSVLVMSGAVVQLVRILACHAGGRGFESRPLRQALFYFLYFCVFLSCLDLFPVIVG